MLLNCLMQKHAIIRSKSEQKFVEWIARKRENDDKKQLEMVKQAAEKVHFPMG